MIQRKIKFKVGDVIRRRPLAQYNYERPIMKIVKITQDLYIFETDGNIKPALEIAAQNEWELYDGRNKWQRAWEKVVEFFHKLFRYHQPKKVDLKHIGRQKKRPGLTMFMYNKKTGEISVAPVQNKMLVVDPDCVYRQALNKKSFEKRLMKERIIKD